MVSPYHDSIGGHAVDHATDGYDALDASSIGAADLLHSHLLRFTDDVPTDPPDDYENGLAFDARPNDGGLYGWNAVAGAWVRLTVPLPSYTGASVWLWAQESDGVVGGIGIIGSAWAWSQEMEGESPPSGIGYVHFHPGLALSGVVSAVGAAASEWAWNTQVPA
jgi:hypothetical protein